MGHRDERADRRRRLRMPSHRPRRSIGGHPCQRPPRIPRTAACAADVASAVFQHPGFHVRRETSTAGVTGCIGAIVCAVAGVCAGRLVAAYLFGSAARPICLGRAHRAAGCRDIFRFDQDDVVERWDVLQTIPPAVSQRPHHVLTVPIAAERSVAVSPRWAVEAKSPEVPHAGTGRARGVGSQDVAQSGSAGERSEPGRLQRRPRPRGVTAVGVCNEGEVDGAGEQTTSCTSGGPVSAPGRGVLGGRRLPK
jgi:hypothetical protein